MKKLILKLLVVALFFQGHISTAVASEADDIQAIINFNNSMSASPLNISDEDYEQMMEANESAGETPLTAAEEKAFQQQQAAQADENQKSSTVEDISGVTNIAELQKATQTRIAKVGGTWGVHVIYISKDDPSQKITLTARNIHQSLAPASTMKLFSGYLAFINKTYPVNDLSYCLHVSSNPMAMQALKSVGGTLAKSVAIMKKQFAGLEDLSKLQVIDGAGLSRSNRVTARLESALLEKIYTGGKYNSFKLLLAQPGEIGTMRNSLVDLNSSVGRVYAKTGTLPKGRVKGLSGFVESSKGVMIFAMIANGVETGSAKLAMLNLIDTHARYLKSQGDL